MILRHLAPAAVMLWSATVISTFAQAATPEELCFKGRYTAAAKYAVCTLKIAGGVSGGSNEVGWVRCRNKYINTWAKLAAKALGNGSSCDRPRFVVSAGTVFDNLTGLQWEQKTDDDGIHDKDNTYTWTSMVGEAAANGTAFTSFVPALNSAGCLAGYCDWRLPSFQELQTILLPAPDVAGCEASPCIDAVTFGPTVAENYWSADRSFISGQSAMFVSFGSGVTSATSKDTALAVRAVRGGL